MRRQGSAPQSIGRNNAARILTKSVVLFTYYKTEKPCRRAPNTTSSVAVSSTSSAGEKELASKLSVFIDSMAGVLFKDLDVAHCFATINEQS